MKILVCASEYPPHASGIGNVAERMVVEFEGRGHACTVCSPSGPDIYLGNAGAIQKLGGLGVLYFWEGVRRHFSSRADRWDAVWLHWPMFLGSCPFQRAVCTFHGSYSGFREMAGQMKSPLWVRWYYGFMCATERRYLAQLTPTGCVFTAVSRRAVAELQVQGLSGHDIHYIPVGVDTDSFQPMANKRDVRLPFGIPAEALVLLYVGRLSRPKNLFRLIDAFAELRAQVNRALLLLAGDGELRDSLGRYIAQKGVPDVQLLGFVPHEDLPGLYGAADFFVMSSRYEGQPVALMEAMAVGLAPIVSNIPVMTEVVKESGSGMVVDFDDPGQAGVRMLEYVSGGAASSDGRRAREYVLANMSSASCAEKYLGLFRGAQL